MRRRALILILTLTGLVAQAWAGDTGTLWLRPAESGNAAEIVVRRNHDGPMSFTLTSLGTQALGNSFRVIGPYGVRVYTSPVAPIVFGPGETSITVTSMANVPGEYRIRFGGEGSLLRVSVPGSPLVLSGFRFSSDPTLAVEPVSGDYAFYVPAGTTSFGLLADLAGAGADDFVTGEVLDGSGEPVATLACGAHGSPYPAPCSRIPVAVPEGRAGAFWQLRLVHNGSVAVALDTIPSILSIQAEDWFEPHRFVIDPARPAGRDCLSLGGAWDGAGRRCTVSTNWEVQKADTLEVLEAATLVLEGSLLNVGAIVNHGTLINHGHIQSTATIFNHGLFENQGTLLSGGTISNLGQFANRGHLTNEGTFDNSGEVQNFCSGTLDGGGEFEGADPLPAGLDTDDDGVCQKADCAPEDPAAWSLPGEAGRLSLTRNGGPHGPHGPVTLSWGAAEAGATGVLYDVQRADLPDFPGASSCVADSLSARQVDDDAQPVVGRAFYYLVVARNSCGSGSPGVASDGTPRVTSGCP